MSIDRMCRWYCIHSLLYYQYHKSVISDERFDNICKELLDRYDEVTEYWREWILKDNLIAGTGYSIYWNTLPSRVQCTAHILFTEKDFSGDDIDVDCWAG